MQFTPQWLKKPALAAASHAHPTQAHRTASPPLPLQQSQPAPRTATPPAINTGFSYSHMANPSSARSESFPGSEGGGGPYTNGHGHGGAHGIAMDEQRPFRYSKEAILALYDPAIVRTRPLELLELGEAGAVILSDKANGPVGLTDMTDEEKKVGSGSGHLVQKTWVLTYVAPTPRFSIHRSTRPCASAPPTPPDPLQTTQLIRRHTFAAGRPPPFRARPLSPARRAERLAADSVAARAARLAARRWTREVAPAQGPSVLELVRRTARRGSATRATSATGRGATAPSGATSAIESVMPGLPGAGREVATSARRRERTGGVRGRCAGGWVRCGAWMAVSEPRGRWPTPEQGS